MPSFLDRMRQSAEKAAFEAERLVRINQAKSVLRGLQRDLQTQVTTMGQQALELYDAGNLTQPELLATCGTIDELREKIEAQEAEVERIRQEEPPSPEEEAAPEPVAPEAAVPEAAPEAVVPSPAPAQTCANCGSPLPADARFCQECGTPVEAA